jgi:hypothetical protein
MENDPLELEKVKATQAIEEFLKVRFELNLMVFLKLIILNLIEIKWCILGFFISSLPLPLESLYKRRNELFLKIMSAAIEFRIKRNLNLNGTLSQCKTALRTQIHLCSALMNGTGRNSLALVFSISRKFQPKYVREVEFAQSSRNKMEFESARLHEALT